MSQARLTPQAANDLEEIEEYISRDNPDAAARLIQEIMETCELLGRHPEAGDERPKLRKGLRGFPVGNYIIFYRIMGNKVEILRVLHGARNMPKFFD